MRLDKNKLLWFGPITVLIEWIVILLGAIFVQNFNPSQAISMASTSPQPLPIIFGCTLTLVAITYTLFTLPLGQYSSRIPVLGVVSGLSFILTGWIPFDGGGGGLANITHSIASFVTVIGYISIVWLMRDHPKTPISQASQRVSKLMIATVLLATVSIYLTHRYLAYVQLLTLCLIQAWTILVVWHELKDSK